MRVRVASRPLFAAALLVAAVASPPANAAACCMSATAFGVGRLLIWEDFAVGLRTSVGGGVGAWDADATWRPYGDYAETLWRSELWGMVALSRRASAYARLPVLATSRRAGAQSDVGGGLADVSVGLRYELLAIGEYVELPAIALTLAVVAPTGRATHAARTPLAVDVTGRGAWALAAGVSLELTRMPWYGRLDLGATVPLPAERPDLGVSQRFGPELAVELAGGVELAPSVVATLVLRFAWHAELTLDGRSVAGSSRRDLGALLAASWRFDPHWTLQLGVDTSFFADHLGDNLPGLVTGSFGLRYGHF